MEEVQTEDLANRVMERVEAKLGLMVERITEQVREVEETATALKEMASSGSMALENIKTEVGNVGKQVMEVAKDIKTMEQQREGRGEVMEGGIVQNDTRTTYATVARVTVPTWHKEVIA